MGQLSRYWKKRTLREKRIILTGLFIAVIYLLVTYIIDPIYASFQAKEQDFKTQSALLKRYEHLIATSDKAREKLYKMKSIEKGISSLLLDSTTPDLASAELQGLVKGIAKKADISFTKITPDKSIEEKGYTIIGLKLPFRGTIKQISQFLYELDNSEKLIAIKFISIKYQRRDGNDLRIELEISAFIRTDIPVPEDTGAEKTQDEQA